MLTVIAMTTRITCTHVVAFAISVSVPVFLLFKLTDFQKWVCVDEDCVAG
jgi:hypothetical protein